MTCNVIAPKALTRAGEDSKVAPHRIAAEHHSGTQASCTGGRTHTTAASTGCLRNGARHTTTARANTNLNHTAVVVAELSLIVGLKVEIDIKPPWLA